MHIVARTTTMSRRNVKDGARCRACVWLIHGQVIHILIWNMYSSCQS